MALIVNDSATHSDITRLESSPWSVDFDFSAKMLRTRDISHLVTHIMQVTHLPNKHRQRIYSILTELCSNALEHGLLKLDARLKTNADGFNQYYQVRTQRLAVLDQGFIKVELSHVPSSDELGELTIVVKDSGDGFNAATPILPLAENRTLSGRGLALVQQLGTQLTINDTGNSFRVSYQLAS